MALKYASRRTCLAGVVWNTMPASRLKRFVQWTAQQLTGMTPTALLNDTMYNAYSFCEQKQTSAWRHYASGYWTVRELWGDHSCLGGNLMGHTRRNVEAINVRISHFPCQTLYSRGLYGMLLCWTTVSIKPEYPGTHRWLLIPYTVHGNIIHFAV